MPRHIKAAEQISQKPPYANLIAELVRELTDQQAFGQPIIEEVHAKNGSIRVHVIWDRWQYMSADDRSAVIVEAYRQVEGEDFADRIGIINGLTVLEAREAGLLEYAVIAAIDEDADLPIDLEKAMLAEGASILNMNRTPELWFGTEAEAEACKWRLSKRIPGSENIWAIIHHVHLEAGQSWDFSDL